MHEEVLSGRQRKLLSLLGSFSPEFGLVGGTAMALQLGYRRSLDFDLLTLKNLNSNKIRESIKRNFEIKGTLVDETNELTLVVNDVKLTFLKYPFNISFTEELKGMIKMPDVLTLASMKVFALGRRAKWKDYVDLYFVFKTKSFTEVVGKAKEIFGSEFNEKLFREQLSYFEDIDYSEKIFYLKGFEVNDEEIKKVLKKMSLQK
jgi:hypothetical protein